MHDLSGPGGVGRRRSGRPLVTAWAAVMATLALAACGGRPEQAPAARADATTATTAWVMRAGAPITVPTTLAEPHPAKSILPDMVVDDVAGGSVNLASLVPSPEPILVWFWAPT